MPCHVIFGLTLPPLQHLFFVTHVFVGVNKRKSHVRVGINNKRKRDGDVRTGCPTFLPPMRVSTSISARLHIEHGEPPSETRPEDRRCRCAQVEV